MEGERPRRRYPAAQRAGPPWPERQGELTEMLGTMPFAVLAGVELESAEASEVRGRLPWAPDRCTVAGSLHGAALVTLADSLGAICAFLNLPPGASTSTIETKTNFFRAVRDGHALGVTTPVHVGRSTIVVQTDVRDAADRRVALVTQTQAVLT